MIKEEKLVEQGRRLEQLIIKEGLSQADFALKTGIKTSTLNHVIKGRNDISSMVMSQILGAFPCFNEDWIRTGIGEMIITTSIENDMVTPNISTFGLGLPLFDIPKQIQPIDPKAENNPNIQVRIKERKISKIIVYYDDNTFETFLQDQ
ncbi:MAG: helix-turn-helix transcriptional regulator [Bacteroidales bacterium]|uniref:helix-turn-helix domain-containing protein n=1 Tax=Porphyromonas sp. TaxID=1924944 RepID=UPI002979E7AF|nr:helix-turn-helix transcriptional regulator [Porphyromonas sp.]MDD7438091.1 helix-turn-helix transcriptional regulator [Bacteroidales bacterium]MDY3067058.1 helix-turn-helix transcriptional regulator [Porphyromonas sp.]